MASADFIPIEVTVDGLVIAADVVPRETLADFLRLKAQATSVHIGCNQGICGACTVVMDGSPVRACLIFAIQADRACVATVASLAALAHESMDEQGMTALQRAFQRHHALQCGFCTPGLLVATTLFLAENPSPDHDAILDHLNGHLCRCTGYASIIAAIESVVAERQAR
jgi:carbon-monoxide dehydrogenase small subunit